MESPAVPLPMSGFHDYPAFISSVCKEAFEMRTDEVNTFVYSDVEPVWAARAIKDLEPKNLKFFKSYSPHTRIFKIRMASDIHNTDQEWFIQSREQWVANGLLTRNERSMLSMAANTLFEFTSGPLIGTSKAPNIALQIRNHGMPNVVFETAYSQSYNDTIADISEWLIGGDGVIRAAVLINWRPSPATMRIRGDVELYGLDRNQMPRLLQREQVFPEATGITRPQAIRLTRRMCFGANVRPGCNPNDVLDLDIGRLRNIVTPVIVSMGYEPA